MDNILKAIDIFNSKHKKWKIYYKTLENIFLIEIKENKLDFTTINFILKVNNTNTVDEIIEILEDLRRDLK